MFGGIAAGTALAQIAGQSAEGAAINTAGGAAAQAAANTAMDQTAQGGANQSAMTYLSAIWSYRIAAAKAAKQFADGVMALFH
jgi:hypothetical protein